MRKKNCCGPYSKSKADKMFLISIENAFFFFSLMFVPLCQRAVLECNEFWPNACSVLNVFIADIPLEQSPTCM